METEIIKSPFLKIEFHSHKVHNPDCDILEGNIDHDTTITYYVHVKGPHKGKEGMEYYRGENYVFPSKLKSYSRNFAVDKIPVKYKQLWQLLRSLYEEMPK